MPYSQESDEFRSQVEKREVTREKVQDKKLS